MAEGQPRLRRHKVARLFRAYCSSAFPRNATFDRIASANHQMNFPELSKMAHENGAVVTAVAVVTVTDVCLSGLRALTVAAYCLSPIQFYSTALRFVLAACSDSVLLPLTVCLHTGIVPYIFATQSQLRCTFLQCSTQLAVHLNLGEFEQFICCCMRKLPSKASAAGGSPYHLLYSVALLMLLSSIHLSVSLMSLALRRSH